ncbi:MAG: hypothetical protein U9Q82_08085 [Chloroflexota bacterium]|nr:hypothetical protein [Chloroflexota bacterium]
MSRSYEMQVEITGLDPSRKGTVKEATESEWPFEGWFRDTNTLIASGTDNLWAGESEKEFATRLTCAIWKANGKFCSVKVRATYLEELPYEEYGFDESKYTEFLSAINKPAPS